MKKTFLFLVCAVLCMTMSAQQIVEDFEANSFNWTEYNYNSAYQAVIAKGKLTIKSDVVSYTAFSETQTYAKIMNLMDPNPLPTHWNRMAASHCVAPIDILKPFTVRANVMAANASSNSSCVGVLFNYRDEMNYYCIAINRNGVRFSRVENGRVVGIEEDPMCPKNMNTMVWEIEKDGEELVFKINDTEFLSLHYTPMQYRGFGFFAYGGASLNVDDVTFVQ